MRRTMLLLVLLTACASPQEQLASDMCEAVEQQDFEALDLVVLQAEADGIPLRQLEAQARMECGPEMDAMQRNVDDLVDTLRELRQEAG